MLPLLVAECRVWPIAHTAAGAGDSLPQNSAQSWYMCFLPVSDPHAFNSAAVKLENDTETFEHERVSSELKKQIQQARLAKKLTQAQVRAALLPIEVQCADVGSPGGVCGGVTWGDCLSFPSFGTRPTLHVACWVT